MSNDNCQHCLYRKTWHSKGSAPLELCMAEPIDMDDGCYWLDIEGFNSDICVLRVAEDD